MYLNTGFKSFLHISMLAALLYFPSSSLAQVEIEGAWRAENEEYIINISQIGTEFQARIVWLKNEKDANGDVKIDVNNPDEKFRKLPIKGLKIITGLVYNSNSKSWDKGKIYIREEGNYYSCKANVKGTLLNIHILDSSGNTARILAFRKQT